MLNRNDHVQRYLATVEKANLEDIYKNMPFSYYANWKKHLGEMLSRLVRAGKVRRIKPGVFEIIIDRKNRGIIQEEDPDQLKLF